MSNFEPPAPPPPPPPPGGYGGPPPPPGPPPGGGYGGGYGGPPPGGGYGGPTNGQWDVGSALGWAWNKFQSNVGQFVVAGLAILGSAIVIGIVYFVLLTTVFSGDERCYTDFFGDRQCVSEGPSVFSSLLLSAITLTLFVVLTSVIGAGIIRSSLGVTEGRAFSTAEVFKFTDLGPVIVTSLLIGAGVLVGTILCFIPGIVFGFVSSYALYFVIDQKLAPVAAIKASFELVKNNLGSTIIWYLVAQVMVSIGAALCGLGLLVAFPLSVLGTAYTYKVLTGRPVVA